METYVIKFLSILLTSGLRYFLLAGIPFLLFYFLCRNRFKRNKIQSREAKRTNFVSEIRNSLMTILVIAAIASLVLFTPFRKLTLVYDQLSDYSLWWIPLSVIVALIIQDTYFYWMHRIVHKPRFFRKVHLTHHQSTNPSPWTSYSFDLLEAILENMILLILVFILPMHPLALMSFGLLGFLINVYGHLGYELMPRGFRRSIWFQVLNTSVYHNLHHKDFHGNYGLYFRFWDRVMKTEHPDYVATYDEIQERRFGKDSLVRSGWSRGTWLLLLPLMLCSFSGSDGADRILGKWISEGENGKAVVRIYQADNGKYYGKVLHALDAQKQLELERKLKEKGKESLSILKGFVHAGNSTWNKGKLYVPSRNLQVSGQLQLMKSGKLKVTGSYFGVSHTYFWTRYQQ
ncbi:MAG: DUF2147 domain-containing protein [Bacteroidetes bacterium]|nr:MAG: DUF2147 domain-containing protein [Bacteroidota bacterium]